MIEKKNPNPFINMANEAKKIKQLNPITKTNVQKVPKSNKGFGIPSVTKRSGRGG